VGKLINTLKFAAVILLILLVDVVAGYLIGTKLLIPRFSSGDPQLTQLKEAGTAAQAPLGDATLPAFTHPLEAINLNPANSSGEIFSCEMTLAVDNQLAVDELTARGAQVKDIVLTYLSAKTVTELNDVTLRTQFRTDMITKINSVLTKGRVTDLYITQWILQM
jgi:flagellar protein FliL